MARVAFTQCMALSNMVYRLLVGRLIVFCDQYPTVCMNPLPIGKYTDSIAYPKKFCSTRWIGDVSVAETVIRLWPEIEKYAKTVLSGPKSQVSRNESFRKPRECVRDGLVISKLHAFTALVDLMKPFLDHTKVRDHCSCSWLKSSTLSARTPCQVYEGPHLENAENNKETIPLQILQGISEVPSWCSDKTPGKITNRVSTGEEYTGYKPNLSDQLSRIWKVPQNSGVTTCSVLIFVMRS